MRSVKKSLLSLCLLLSFSALSFAANKNHANISLSDKVQLGSVELKPGDYTLSWTGTGNDATATLSKGKKILVTIPAKLVEENNKYQGVSITTVAAQTGTRIKSVQLPKLELLFEEAKPAMQEQSTD